MTTTTPDIPAVTGGVLLFRSCLISTEYPGAEAATKWLFERFGIEYTVHPGQSCCTGLGYYSELVPVATSVALAARNACVAVEDGHPVMSYLCSTCYAINKKARNILQVPEYRAETNKVLAGIDREYSDEVAGAIRHSHTMEILWSAHESIPDLIRRRLDGIKVATHPACHYCKVFPDEVVGDSENFMIPEDLLEDTGRRQDRPLQREDHPLRGRLSAALREPFDRHGGDPREAPPAGPGEGRRVRPHVPELRHPVRPPPRDHRDSSHEKYPFVHLHVQQLLALALGADPDKDCGVATHSQDVEPLLARIGARDKVTVAAGGGCR